MPMSLTEIVQQLLDHIKNHPLDWKPTIDHMDRYRNRHRTLPTGF